MLVEGATGKGIMFVVVLVERATGKYACGESYL